MLEAILIKPGRRQKSNAKKKQQKNLVAKIYNRGFFFTMGCSYFPLIIKCFGYLVSSIRTFVEFLRS